MNLETSNKKIMSDLKKKTVKKLINSDSNIYFHFVL